VKRVSSDVDRPSVNHPYQNAASTHTLATDRRDPLFNAREIGFLYRRELRPLQETASQGNGGPCPCAHLYEISAVDLHRMLTKLQIPNPKPQINPKHQLQNFEMILFEVLSFADWSLPGI
jgi:hypothetical protein